ncbi:protein of unknown function DUF81 [SAR116 cluster alpha proteobacterium HIMB100]|nr:protein of unknown function DUF81 [SAR116 cluster alpha proteobacterium HIMB100]
MTDQLLLSLNVACIYLLAGSVKGVFGLGLPTTSVTLMTIFISPLEAIAINLLPMFITNGYQFYKAEDHKALLRSYWPFAFVMLIFLFVFSVFAARLGNDVIRLLIALSVISFAANNLFVKHWRLNPRYDRAWQISLGSISGILGGLTSLWGVPITIYLVMKQVSPRQFVDASGFLILIGCIPLAIGYAATGLIGTASLWPSLAGVITAVIGFTIGEKLRPLLAPDLFHKLLLWMFLIMGARMLYTSLDSYGLV